MDYDQLCKSLLQTMFDDFMRLFFPQVAEQLILDSPEWLPTEMFVAPPEGERRYPDLIAKVRLRDGRTAVIVIHLEIQERRDPQLGKRMHEYYTIVRIGTGCEVFSVALQFHREPDAKAAIERAVYTESCLGEERLWFSYHRILVPLLSAEEYLAKENPLGLALATRMKKPRRLRGKALAVEVMERLLTGKYTYEQILAAWNFVIYSTRLKPQEVREVRQAAEHGKKQVPAELLEAGREVIDALLDIKRDHMRQALMTALEDKFGTVPDAVQATINEMDYDEMNRVFQGVVTDRLRKVIELLPEKPKRPARAKKNGKK
jgi:hypothetical protein